MAALGGAFAPAKSRAPLLFHVQGRATHLCAHNLACQAVLHTKNTQNAPPRPGGRSRRADGSEDVASIHSAEPVARGEKWIATVWMREGVSLERPQSMFDPSGGLLASDDTDTN